MTSDYLGQWYHNGTTWVEANLFEYAGTAGHVEGMGFGALGHAYPEVQVLYNMNYT